MNEKREPKMKTITWSNNHFYLSNFRDNTCSRMPADSDVITSRDFSSSGISCLSPNAVFVAVREEDGSVRVRTVVSNAEEWRPGDVLFTCQKLSSSPIINFAWSPNYLAVQQSDGTTSTYQINTRTGRGIQKGAYHPDRTSPSAFAMAFSPTRGDYLIQATRSGTVLWDASNSRVIREIGPGSGMPLGVAWSPDGRHVAMGRNDSSIGIYLMRGRSLAEWTGHTAGVSALAFSPDGKFLVSGDLSGSMQLWNTSSNNAEDWHRLVSVDPSMPGGIEAFAWETGSKRFAVVDAQDTLDVFNV